METPELPPKPRWTNDAFNFNTLIGIIAVAAISWVANKTTSTSETVTEIRTSLPYVIQNVAELKSQIDKLVTRAELDAKVAEMRASQETLNTRLLKLEFEKRNLNHDP